MKRRAKKLLLAIGITMTAYLGGLFALSLMLESVVEDRIVERLAIAFRADEVEVGEVSVSLLRGKIVLRDVKAERSSSKLVGSARIELKELRLDTRAWGISLIEAQPISARVEGAQLHFSVMGVGTMEPSASRALEIESLEIVDSGITLVASDYFPSAGRASLQIEHSLAQKVTLTSAISWLHAIQTLQGRFEIPGDSEIQVDYEDKKLRLGGKFFGSSPVEVPFRIPMSDPRELEWKQLATLATEIATQVGPTIAKQRASEAWGEFLDLLP